MTPIYFRAGITTTSGTGWIRLIVRSSSWPFDKIILTERGLVIEPTFLDRLIGSGKHTILWQWVQSIEPIWFGMKVVYHECNETYEMEIISPGCYDSTTSFLRQLADEWNLFPASQ